MIRLIILHNYPSPYRLPLFQKLSKIYDLEVWFLQDPKSDERLWLNSINSNYTFKYKFIKSKTLNIFSKSFVLNKNLIKKLYNYNYDICISSDNFPIITSLFISFFISKLNKKKIIIWSPIYKNENVISKFIVVNFIYKIVYSIYRRIIYPKSDFIFTYSNWGENFIKKNYNSNVKKLPQVYPSELLFESLNKEKIKLKNKIILYVGYLNPRKNLDFLINNFKSSPYMDWKLIIIGDGPSRSNLEKLSSSDPRIYFTGNLEGEEKYSYIRKSKVLVLLSNKDSWGLTVNEAMSFGLPVIVSENVEAKEMINNNGFIIKHNSSNELMKSLTKILNDDKLFKYFSNNSLKNIKIYSIDNFINIFQSGIKFVMNNTRSF